MAGFQYTAGKSFILLYNITSKHTLLFACLTERDDTEDMQLSQVRWSKFTFEHFLSPMTHH